MAVPLALVGGVGKAAEHGVLIRSGEALQTASTLQTIVLDKTGTITEGKPELTDTEADAGFDADRVLYYAASVDRPSEHPTAQAIVQVANSRGLAPNERTAQAIARQVGIVFLALSQGGGNVTETNGVQEAVIRVKGGSEPDVVINKKDRPVRLLFQRHESSLCSEMVVFDSISQSAHLPEGQTVAIEFTPHEKGEIPFQCQMGMLRGKLVVQ